jgi:hypothetical protein
VFRSQARACRRRAALGDRRCDRRQAGWQLNAGAVDDGALQHHHNLQPLRRAAPHRVRRQFRAAMTERRSGSAAWLGVTSRPSSFAGWSCRPAALQLGLVVADGVRRDCVNRSDAAVGIADRGMDALELGRAVNELGGSEPSSNSVQDKIRRRPRRRQL